MHCSFNGSAERIRQASEFLPGGVSSNFRLGISPTPLVFDHAEGPYPLRRRRQPADRLLPRHGADDPRPPAGGGRRGRAPAARARHPLRRPERGRVRGRRARLRHAALRREGALLRRRAPRWCRPRSGSRAPRPAAASIVKFEGHYHGWFDNVLWSVAPAPTRMGAEAAPVPQPGTTGQDALAGHTHRGALLEPPRLPRGAAVARRRRRR